MTDLPTDLFCQIFKSLSFDDIISTLKTSKVAIKNTTCITELNDNKINAFYLPMFKNLRSINGVVKANKPEHLSALIGLKFNKLRVDTTISKYEDFIDIAAYIIQKMFEYNDLDRRFEIYSLVGNGVIVDHQGIRFEFSKPNGHSIDSKIAIEWFKRFDLPFTALDCYLLSPLAIKESIKLCPTINTLIFDNNSNDQMLVLLGNNRLPQTITQIRYEEKKVSSEFIRKMNELTLSHENISTLAFNVTDPGDLKILRKVFPNTTTYELYSGTTKDKEVLAKDNKDLTII